MVLDALDPKRAFFKQLGLTRDYLVGDTYGFRPAGFRMHDLVELQVLVDNGTVQAAELLLSRDLAAHRQQGYLAREAALSFLRECRLEEVGLPEDGWYETPCERQCARVRLVMRAVGGRVSLMVLGPEAAVCAHCERVTLGRTGKCSHCQSSLGKGSWWKLGWRR